MPTQPACWRLDGKETCLLVLHDAGVPRLYWYGRQLAHGTCSASLAALADTALSDGGMDTPLVMSLLPEAASGYAGSPGLAGHRQGGGFAHRFSVADVVAAPQSLHLRLEDKVAQLQLVIALTLDAASDVATLSTTLRNTGDSTFHVDWLASATLPLPTHLNDMLSYHGRWGRESQPCRRRLGPGRLDISNLHGRTSHEHAPGLIVGAAGFDEDHGDVLFTHLAWSGNFSLRVERHADGLGSLQAGMLLLPGEGDLAAGATLETPPLLFTLGAGMNSCTQRFHRYARTSVLPAWTRKPRPIHANSWEALYFNHEVNAVLALIDAAAAVGAERFVLDDGWFMHRRHDRAGLGDWHVDPAVYPDGLQPIVKRAHDHGLQFGLWFEPEMVNPDSDLYRAHPDWALHHDGYETPLARNQLTLDLQNEAVFDYLYERIVALVQELSIDYIKWDLNRNMVLAGRGTECRAAGQAPALYRLLAAILETCSGLEIESCASGGARADLGILRYTGRVWASDNIDPIERATIQRGYARFLPPETMGAHVGHKYAHLTGRETSLHTRAIVALQGQFGFEIDARVFDPEDVQVLQHYTSLYQCNRGWLNEACYWQLPTVADSLLAHSLVAPDQHRAWVFVTLVASLPGSRCGMLALRGLVPEALYELYLGSDNLSELRPFNRALPGWCEQPVRVSGELLMAVGVPLPVLPPQRALLIVCDRIDT